MRNFILIVALLLGLHTAAAAADDIVVGGGLVISGPFASYGTDAKAGVELAIDEINRNGGVLGRKLRAQYEDSGGDRARAVAIYRKFAADPSVAAALLISSSEFVAVNPVSRDAGLPFISIGSVIPFQDFSPCAFRVNLILSNAMGAVLDQLGAKGVKRIAIIFDQSNNQTVAEAEIVKASLASKNMELASIETYNTGEQNFTLQLSRIQQSKPDLLWVSATTDEGSQIISQARSLGMNYRIIGGAGLNDPRIGQLSGGAADGVMTFALFNLKDPRPVVQRFVSAFKERYRGDLPSAYNALGYDTIGLIADAIRRAGSTERSAVCRALGETKSFEGVNGQFSYAGSGDNTAQRPRILIYRENGYTPAD